MYIHLSIHQWLKKSNIVWRNNNLRNGRLKCSHYNINKIYIMLLNELNMALIWRNYTFLLKHINTIIYLESTIMCQLFPLLINKLHVIPIRIQRAFTIFLGNKLSCLYIRINAVDQLKMKKRSKLEPASNIKTDCQKKQLSIVLI